jgi:hypothetical protein
VTYFRSRVVKFIFGGRNSGQGQPKAAGNRDVAGLLPRWLFKRTGLVQGGKRLDVALVNRFRVVTRDIPRDDKNAALAVELNAVCGERG